MSNNSINTNYGAAVALQTLNATNTALNTTQNRISTGLKVNSAADDSAVWSIAQTMRSQNTALDTVTSSLNRGISTLGVANTAGSAISDLLTQMQSTVLAASDQSLDAASRASYQQKYQSLAQQVQTYVKNAAFNGVNLLNGSTTSYSALANSDGTSTIVAAGQNLNLSTGYTGGAAAVLSSQTAYGGPSSVANVFTISQPSSFTVTTSGSATPTNNVAVTVNLQAGAYTAATLATAIQSAYAAAGGAGTIADSTTNPNQVTLKGNGATENIALSNGSGDLSGSNLSTFFGGTLSAASGTNAATGTLTNVVTGGAALTQSSAFTLTTDSNASFNVTLSAGYHSVADVASQINNAYAAAGNTGTAATVVNGKLQLNGLAPTATAASGVGVATSGSGDLSTAAKLDTFLGFYNAGAAAVSSSSTGTAATAFSETGGGGAILVSGSEGFTTTTNYADLISKIKQSITNVSTALGSLGTATNAMTNHATFISKLQDSLTTGVGNLVDADVAKESANLTALQTKQQLGVQALSIANSSSSTLLSLFRG